MIIHFLIKDIIIFINHFSYNFVLTYHLLYLIHEFINLFIVIINFIELDILFINYLFKFINRQLPNFFI
jgi:hypothetical protein